MSHPGENGRDSLPEHGQDSGYHDYVVQRTHENKILPLNDFARPVFVNHQLCDLSKVIESDFLISPGDI